MQSCAKKVPTFKLDRGCLQEDDHSRRSWKTGCKSQEVFYSIFLLLIYFLLYSWCPRLYNLERVEKRRNAHARVFDARLIRDQKFGWTFFPPFCSPIFQKQSKLFTFHLFFSYSLYLEEYIFLLSHFSTPQKNFWQPRFERLPMTECFIERSQDIKWKMRLNTGW